MVGLLVFLYCLVYLQQEAFALHNVTVDDNDTVAIRYSGSWESAPSPLDFGGSHRLSDDTNALATFIFTGVAIYFSSPLWPYPVATGVSLDGGPVAILDLMDRSRPNTDGGPETILSSVVWAATGLANTQHVLVVTVGRSPASGANDPQYAIVDGLVYTIVDEEMSTSISVPSEWTTTISPTVLVPQSSTTTTTTSPKSKSLEFTVIIAVICALMGVLLPLAIVLFLVWRFRRRRQRSLPIQRRWTIDTTPPPTSTSTIFMQRFYDVSNSPISTPLRHGDRSSLPDPSFQTPSRPTYVTGGHVSYLHPHSDTLTRLTFTPHPIAC